MLSSRKSAVLLFSYLEVFKLYEGFSLCSSEPGYGLQLAFAPPPNDFSFRKVKSNGKSKQEEEVEHPRTQRKFLLSTDRRKARALE